MFIKNVHTGKVKQIVVIASNKAPLRVIIVTNDRMKDNAFRIKTEGKKKNRVTYTTRGDRGVIDYDDRLEGHPPSSGPSWSTSYTPAKGKKTVRNPGKCLATVTIEVAPGHLVTY